MRKTGTYREVKVQGHTASAGVEIRMGLFDSTSLPLKSFMLSPQHTRCGERMMADDMHKLHPNVE